MLNKTARWNFQVINHIGVGLQIHLVLWHVDLGFLWGEFHIRTPESKCFEARLAF